MSTIYEDNGYQNREHYLDTLAETLGLDQTEVHALADLLGPTEDFDALVSALEDQASVSF